MRFSFVFAVIASIGVTITAMPNAVSDAHDNLMPRSLPPQVNLNPRTTSELQGGVHSTNKLETRQWWGRGGDGGGSVFSVANGTPGNR
ncbi:secreted protein [Melampsora americana]|nr:secreted protein [Melampsora americana]